MIELSIKNICGPRMWHPPGKILRVVVIKGPLDTVLVATTIFFLKHA